MNLLVFEMDIEQIRQLISNENFELLETHISWVLVGNEYVYKIKKPVKFSFLDFSTLEKRKYLCEEEIRLNRRLVPDMYIRVVGIANENGKLVLERDGDVIEYAIKMKLLPQERRMDLLMKANKVEKEEIQKIAEMVAGFHEKIETISDQKYSSAEVVKKQIDDLANFREVIENACGLGETVEHVLSKCERFIGKNKTLFEKRQKDGKLKDCHGDLHSANIFILENKRTVIFDCIEFSKDFRYIDVASEIAFMAMDLDAFGREDFAKLFVERYVELGSDHEVGKLLNLYKCYRANVRAKIAAIDYSQHPDEDAKKRIEKYMHLAERYATLLTTS